MIKVTNHDKRLHKRSPTFFFLSRNLDNDFFNLLSKVHDSLSTLAISYRKVTKGEGVSGTSTYILGCVDLNKIMGVIINLLAYKKGKCAYPEFKKMQNA